MLTPSSTIVTSYMGLLSTLNLASATEELNLSFNIILINLTSHCGNKQRPTKQEQAKSLYTEFALTRESDTVSLHSAFYRGSKAGRGSGKLYGGKKGRFPVCPDWRLSAWGRRRHLEVVQPMSLVRGTQLAFSDLSYAGNGHKKERKCQL